MNAVETMKYTNNITLDISEKLGVLTRYGILSPAYCQNVIFDMSQMQLRWMNQKFAPEEVSEFMHSL